MSLIDVDHQENPVDGRRSRPLGTTIAPDAANAITMEAKEGAQS